MVVLLTWLPTWPPATSYNVLHACLKKSREKTDPKKSTQSLYNEAEQTPQDSDVTDEMSHKDKVKLNTSLWEYFTSFEAGRRVLHEVHLHRLVEITRPC